MRSTRARHAAEPAEPLYGERGITEAEVYIPATNWRVPLLALLHPDPQDCTEGWEPEALSPRSAAEEERHRIEVAAARERNYLRALKWAKQECAAQAMTFDSQADALLWVERLWWAENARGFTFEEQRRFRRVAEGLMIAQQCEDEQRAARIERSVMSQVTPPGAA